VVLSDYTVDLFFILLGLVLVRKARTIQLSIILFAVVAVMLGGLAADAIGEALVAGTSFSQATTHTGNPGILALLGLALLRSVAAIPFIFLVNYLLSRSVFQTTRRESAVIALVVAICTAPLVYNISDVVRVSHLIGFGPDTFAIHFGRAQAGDWILLVSGVTDAIFMSMVIDGNLRRRVVASSVFGIVVAGVSCGIAVDLAYLDRIQGKMDDCNHQLRTISGALYSYVHDHAEYPPTLRALVPKYLPDAGTLHCPADTAGRETVSYTYRPPKWYEDSNSWVHCPMHDGRDLACATRQMDLLKAIRDYHESKGSYPAKLHDLVPEFADESMLKCPLSPNGAAYVYRKPPNDADPSHPGPWIVRCAHHGSRDKWIYLYIGIPLPVREQR
jgi:hypothetical protein